MCEPPMITRHTSKMFVMEGQEVSLRCKSIGDPEPSTHWVSPDGKLIGNTSRTVCYENGSLDILKASVKVRDVNIHSEELSAWPPQERHSCCSFNLDLHFIFGLTHCTAQYIKKMTAQCDTGTVYMLKKLNR